MNRQWTIEQRLVEARGFRNCVASHSFEGLRQTYRNGVFLALHGMVFEHHLAIWSLLRLERNVSAFALLRVIAEGAYRGCWVMACPTHEKLSAKSFSFPSLDRMSSQLDKKIGLEGRFRDVLLPRLDALNDYTHNGLGTLSRFYKDESYSERARIWAMQFADQCLCMTAMVGLGECGSHDAVHEICTRYTDNLMDF